MSVSGVIYEIHVPTEKIVRSKLASFASDYDLAEKYVANLSKNTCHSNQCASCATDLPYYKNVCITKNDMWWVVHGDEIIQSSKIIAVTMSPTEANNLTQKHKFSFITIRSVV